MKKIAGMACVIGLFAAAVQAGESATTPADAKEKVGIYDSRAIVVAFVGSEIYKATDGKHVNEMMAEFNKAKAEGNQKRVAELEAEGNALQVKLHKQGFSTAPVDEILEHIKNQVPEIAKAAGVGPIISKWDKEALAKHETAEKVDVTMALVDAFHPTGKQRIAAAEIQTHQPIPLKQAENLKD